MKKAFLIIAILASFAACTPKTGNVIPLSDSTAMIVDTIMVSDTTIIDTVQ